MKAGSDRDKFIDRRFDSAFALFAGVGLWLGEAWWRGVRLGSVQPREKAGSITHGGWRVPRLGAKGPEMEVGAEPAVSSTSKT